jgi:large conductance mechanosensitive channel protein
MWREFKTFLITQNALALAIAVVVGSALDTVVKAIVDGLLMPLVAPLQQATGGDYAKLVWAVGPFRFGPGVVLAALVNFVIVGFVAWRLSKLFVRETPESQLAASGSFANMTKTNWRWVSTALEHATWTLGQTVPYLRANAVTPPQYLPF